MLIKKCLSCAHNEQVQMCTKEQQRFNFFHKLSISIVDMAWIHYIKQIESTLGEQAKKVQKQKVVRCFKNLLLENKKQKYQILETQHSKPTEDNFTQNHIQTYQLKYSIATVQQTITIQTTSTSNTPLHPSRSSNQNSKFKNFEWPPY